MTHKLTPEEKASIAEFKATHDARMERIAANRKAGALKAAATRRLNRLARADMICEAAHTHANECACSEAKAPVNMLEPCLEARLNVTPESIGEFMKANPLPGPNRSV